MNGIKSINHRPNSIIFQNTGELKSDFSDLFFSISKKLKSIQISPSNSSKTSSESPSPKDSLTNGSDFENASQMRRYKHELMRVQSQDSNNIFPEMKLDISTGHIVLSYMEEHVKSKNLLDAEWDSINNYVVEDVTTKDALKLENSRKNRDRNILPYDHNRVILNQAANINKSDYINASNIINKNPNQSEYIFTQSPLPHTVADFWQMVWEQNSSSIVYLTSAEENLNNFWQYWPNAGSITYQKYEVCLVSEHVSCAEYVIRNLTLCKVFSNESRTVTQYHYTAWPLHGVPKSIDNLLGFRRKVNRFKQGHSIPLIIHCSNGSGRTGTYSLIDMVLQSLTNGTKELDLVASLEHLRDQRMNAVENKVQFDFVFFTLVQFINQAMLPFASTPQD